MISRKSDRVCVHASRKESFILQVSFFLFGLLIKKKEERQLTDGGIVDGGSIGRGGVSGSWSGSISDPVDGDLDAGGGTALVEIDAGGEDRGRLLIVHTGERGDEQDEEIGYLDSPGLGAG
jgi:hypothetical protein